MRLIWRTGPGKDQTTPQNGRIAPDSAGQVQSDGGGMTGEPDPPQSAAWWDGYRLGQAHRATGEMACICGGSQQALDKAAGYTAGRGLARVPGRGAEAG